MNVKDLLYCYDTLLQTMRDNNQCSQEINSVSVYLHFHVVTSRNRNNQSLFTDANFRRRWLLVHISGFVQCSLQRSNYCAKYVFRMNSHMRKKWTPLPFSKHGSDGQAQNEWSSSLGSCFVACNVLLVSTPTVQRSHWKWMHLDVLVKHSEMIGASPLLWMHTDKPIHVF